MNTVLKPQIVVFLGPSMSLDEAKSILDAHYLPPARHGDLLSAVHNFRPRAIGLVDGEFSQALSVWHKEILYALEEGIQVYGAASMGALRAAETESFGMVGIGEIFTMFRDEILQDDDEVALQYSSASDGYRNLSMPMVNIRATLEHAFEEGRIKRRELDLTVKLAKSLFFRNRVVPTIRQKMLDSNIDEPSADNVCKSLENHYVDLKREDTRELLRTLVNAPTESLTQRCWSLNQSAQFRTMVNQDRKTQHSGVDVSQSQIARCTALHDPDFNENNFNARNRMLAQLLAEILNVGVDPAEIDAESERFRTREHLLGRVAFDSWLDRNDLDEQTFKALMQEISICRKLHCWLTANESDAVSTQALLNEYRLRGHYTRAATRAASLSDLADLKHPDVGSDDESEAFLDLVAEHLEFTDWALETDCKEWALEAGFTNLALLKKELQRARRARRRVALLARKVAKDIF